MSSPASRRRQRHRRRAHHRVYAAQTALAERHVDLVSYTRVVADMEKRLDPAQSPTAMIAITVVRSLLGKTAEDCTKIEATIAELEQAVVEQESIPSSDPEESMQP
jgi:hypothetical protein